MINLKDNKLQLFMRQICKHQYDKNNKGKKIQYSFILHTEICHSETSHRSNTMTGSGWKDMGIKGGIKIKIMTIFGKIK